MDYCKDVGRKKLVRKYQRLAGKPTKGQRWNRSWRRKLLSRFEYYKEVAAMGMAREILKEEDDRILHRLMDAFVAGEM